MARCTCCGKSGLFLELTADGICYPCAEKGEIGEPTQRKKRISEHLLTTGYTFEKMEITKYNGLVSGEVVIGTGWISDLSAGISDMFGTASVEYAEKIKNVKNEALRDMIESSIAVGGNAVIGIKFEYMTFSGNMIGVSVYGTSVNIVSAPNLVCAL